MSLLTQRYVSYVIFYSLPIFCNKKKWNFHSECKYNQSLGYCKQMGIKRRHV